VGYCTKNKKDIVGITKRKIYLCAKPLHNKMDTKKDLTPKDKVAIKSLVFGIVLNWTDAYKIAYDGKQKDLEKIKYLPTIVSRWKRNPKIQDYYNECLYLHKQEEERKRAEILQGFQDDGGKEEKGGADSVRTKRTSAKMVDFSNPQNQMQKLNELVNSSDDVGETLDALKVIISTQKADRESAREGKAVKAYLPMTCNDCPLYQRRKNRLQY
jgi:hypothetical protein